MAESAVLLALKTIGSLLIEEGKFLYGMKDQVLQLQRELEWMQWFLKDADEKMIEDQRNIQQWILGVKDVAYDAGYLLEDYAFKVGSRGCGGFIEILSRSACILNDSYLRHKFGSEIQALNTRILNLKNNFQAYGVRDIMEKEGSSSRKQLLRRTYSFVEEEDFVGLEDDVDLLVKHLVSEDDVRVVSIWGMGGLGKTTLANKVYKHPRVKRHFNRFAWVCVSQQWQTKDVLQRIVIKLIPEKKYQIEKQREDELISQLFKIQQESKCLIVIDDIWTEDAWESIKTAFPNNERGSKILLTTRIREVALHIGPDGVHHEPRLLREDESWDLLKRKALRERYDEGHCTNIIQLHEVEELGKKMVKYCGGLPLAVVVLGGILLANNTLNGWVKVNEDIKSYLWKQKGIGKGKGELERILALSYYDLPFQLKPCFLYLSALPEDTDIDAETLCQKWIAEGMVLTKDRVGEESMMELAERYLGELGQRGMVQCGTLSPLHGDYDPARFRRSCRLHDLMRDLCLRKAEEESFLKCINYSSEEKDAYASLYESSTCKLRRLVINLDSGDVCRYVPPKKEITKYIRMLQFVVNGRYEGRMAKTIKSQLNNFEMLHVLSIEGLRSVHYFRVWKVPKAIGKLIHLRYLSFKGSFLGTLPSSLGNLKHLQTLDLGETYFQLRIPNILWKMKELTCLYLPSDLGRCKRVLLDGLNDLEVLENFDDKYCYTEDLLKLNNLRILTISKCVEFENLEMIANYAESSNKLQVLSIIEIECDLYSEKERGLSVLKQLLFGRNIHHLGIQGQLWKFPKFESNMSSSLVELEIWRCGLDAEEVISGTLEKFTHLRKLWLNNLRGKEMVFHAMGFPQLRELYLFDFEDLEKWVVEEGAMPNLRTLSLDKFPKLTEIHDSLQFLINLEKLSISNMSVEFLEKIETANISFFSLF